MLFRTILATTIVSIASAQNNGGLDGFTTGTGAADAAATTQEVDTNAIATASAVQIETLANTLENTVTLAETATTAPTPVVQSTLANTIPNLTTEETNTGTTTGSTTVWWTPETTVWWTPSSNSWWTPETTTTLGTATSSDAAILISSLTSGSITTQVTLSKSGSTYYTVSNYSNSTNGAIGGIAQDNMLARIAIPVAFGAAFLFA